MRFATEHASRPRQEPIRWQPNRLWSLSGSFGIAGLCLSYFFVVCFCGEPAPISPRQTLARPGNRTSGFLEVAFLYRPCRSLILTDHVQNLEPDKLPHVTRASARLVDGASPGGVPLHVCLILRLRAGPAREGSRACCLESGAGDLRLWADIRERWSRPAPPRPVVAPRLTRRPRRRRRPQLIRGGSRSNEGRLGRPSGPPRPGMVRFSSCCSTAAGSRLVCPCR